MIIAVYVIIFVVLISLVWQNKNGTGFDWIVKNLGKFNWFDLLVVLAVILVFMIMNNPVMKSLKRLEDPRPYEEVANQELKMIKEYPVLKHQLNSQSAKLEKFLKEHKRMRRYFE